MDMLAGAQLVSASAAMAAVVVAAAQIRGLRKDALVARAIEIEGVAVETDVVSRPRTAENGSDKSVWVYRFTVHNPGRHPVSNVRVGIHFPVDVIRRHYDGATDEPTRELELAVPVVPAHGSKSWKRTVLIVHSERSRLRETAAMVSFTSPDGGRRSTTWPAESSNFRLNKRLGALLDGS